VVHASHYTLINFEGIYSIDTEVVCQATATVSMRPLLSNEIIANSTLEFECPDGNECFHSINIEERKRGGVDTIKVRE